MNKFTVRIDVFEETKESKAELEFVMKSYDFKKTITADGGSTYQLPPNEYSYEGQIERKALLEKVKAGAGQIGKKYSVLITESRGRTWFNLQPITDAE